LLQEALKLPNIAHADAPVGDEDASRIVVQVGEPRVFGFRPRSHIEIGARHRWFDFEAGTAVSGPKFVFLRREAVLLEMALVQWALNELQSRGFELTLPPDVVHTSTAAACGYQPRGVASQVYTLSSHGVGDTRSSHDDSDEQSLCLVGTSEIPLTAQFAGRVLDASRLPLRCAAFGHCFRAEAGAGGLAAGGLYRLHQFSKVEMVVLANAKHSDAVLEELVHIQRDLYASLGLSFRFVVEFWCERVSDRARARSIRDMATGDLGAAAQRKFDLEAWMPSRNAWGELCSASNCTDYQSRRLNVRASDTTQQGARPEYVHTLNATAMAAPRVMLALIEQHQTADGRVAVPAPLRPYLNARTHLP
jgi:seryl-tRNA synthetase